MIDHDDNGKPIYKSFYSRKSKNDAWAKAEQYKLDLEIAARTGEAASVYSSITFTAWAEKWLKSYKKPTVTAQTYRNTYESTVGNHLIPYFGNKRLVIN